jgi:hypothetical protein
MVPHAGHSLAMVGPVRAFGTPALTEPYHGHERDTCAQAESGARA